MPTTLHDADVDERELVRTARITGLFYLGIIVPAIFGCFIIRGQMFDPVDAAATLSSLAERETLARIHCRCAGVADRLRTLDRGAPGGQGRPPPSRLTTRRIQ